MYNGYSKGIHLKARAIINRLASKGISKITLADEEEIVGTFNIKTAKGRDDLFAEMGATAMDTLTVERGTMEGQWLTLIYGNEPDGSDLINDHTMGLEKILAGL